MRLLSFLLVSLAIAIPALAQTAAPMDSATCATQTAAIEQEMDAARDKGQMLRRRQLAEALTALQARCGAPASDLGRAASVERLEQHIRQLRTELEQAEAQLRKLQGAQP